MDYKDKPLFHLCKPLKEGQLPESVESIGCKTALKDLKETIGCFQTPHVLEVTCPECLRAMANTTDKPDSQYIHRYWNCDKKSDLFAGTHTMREVLDKLETFWTKVTCPSCREIGTVRQCQIS